MQQRHQISIVHFLLWMAITAGYLVTVRQHARTTPGTIGGLILVGVSSLAGAAISVALTVAYRQLRGIRHEATPAEWLAWVVGIIMAVDLIAPLILNQTVVSSSAVRQVAFCLALLPPVLSQRLERPWQGYFTGLLLLQCLLVAGQLANLLGRNPQFTFERLRLAKAIVVTAAPVVITVFSKKQTDWMHWLGVSIHSLWGIMLFVPLAK